MLVGINFTGGDYFRAIGIRLLQGRTFTNDEAVTPNTSVIVSRSAAEKLWHAAVRREGRESHGVRWDVGDDALRGDAGELHAGAAGEQRVRRSR